jgi:hypothetical protein
MLRIAPSFPPIETWAKMSESEQDAVIQAMESARRGRSRLAIALTCLGICTAIAILCYSAQLSPI